MLGNVRNRTYPGTINGTLHCPVLEQNVRDVTVETIPTQGSNGQTVAGESAIAILSDDVVGTMDNRDAIVSVVAIVSIENDVLAGQVEAVSVLKPRVSQAISSLVLNSRKGMI